LHTGDERAVNAGHDESALAGRLDAAAAAGGRIVAVQLAALDVDEPERAVARVPHRTFAQRGAEVPPALDGQRQPASTK
jgi:hypothetical protein